MNLKAWRKHRIETRLAKARARLLVWAEVGKLQTEVSGGFVFRLEDLSASVAKWETKLKHINES